MIIEHRQREVDASAEKVYLEFTGLGGDRGWLYMNWAWAIRGFIDRRLGGVGLRRGRRDPQDLRVGDALDFWRVEEIEEDQSMRLRAEMLVPGLAWLQFKVSSKNDATVLEQTAFFAPKGIFGWLYWYALYPIHGLIFSGLINSIAKRAEQQG